jgi:hypothetical protein
VIITGTIHVTIGQQATVCGLTLCAKANKNTWLANRLQNYYEKITYTSLVWFCTLLLKILPHWVKNLIVKFCVKKFYN